MQLAALLCGLAVGLWPGAVCPSRQEIPAAPLPTLQCLAISQVVYFLLVWPMATLIQRRQQGGGALSMTAELLLHAAIAAPFYVAGAFLADATLTDGLRTVLYVASLLPLSLAGGMWLTRRPAWRAVTVLVLLAAVLGLPAAYYIAREFFYASPLGYAKQLWRLGPITFAWEAAGSRMSFLLARPIWAAVVWAVVGTFAALWELAIPRSENVR